MSGKPSPRYFKAWITFFLITSAVGLFVGGMLGGFLGITLSLAHVSLGVIKAVAAILGFLIGIPISYYTFRWVVSELIKEIEEAAEADVQEAPAQEPPVI
jgi:membrane associated rhomboid family serine protease